MKKTLLSSIMLCSVLMVAQNKTSTNATHSEPAHAFKKSNLQVFKGTKFSSVNKTSSQVGSAWFNQVDFIELIQPNTQVFSAMHVFPDSAIIWGYDSGNLPVNPYIHRAANYMDPYFMAQQTIITDKLTTYFLDSVSVGYLYERNTGLADNTADSLIIQVIAEKTANNYDLTGPPAFSYQDITYNYATDKVTMTILKRIAVPLTYADTCSGSVYKQIVVATPGIAGQINSKKIGTVISFKPGYTYTPTDVLLGDATNVATKNIFMILSSEQNGLGTDPTYFGTVSDYTSDMNMSFILPTDVKYNINANGWNGYFLPTYAYTAPFAYESHDIGYKLRVASLPVGIEELEKNGFTLGQNVPNPFSNESIINYQLANDAKSTLFTVSDVTGRVVSTELVNSNKGSHSIKLPSYASGLYYYTLNVDGIFTSKKMILE